MPSVLNWRPFRHHYSRMHPTQDALQGQISLACSHSTTEAHGTVRLCINQYSRRPVRQSNEHGGGQAVNPITHPREGIQQTSACPKGGLSPLPAFSKLLTEATLLQAVLSVITE